MTDFSLPTLCAIIVTFILAGLVKGVTGMGLPTVAMALLGATLSPVAAAGLLIVPSLVTNVWQLVCGPALGRLAHRLWGMLLGIVAGTFIGAGALAGGSSRWSVASLGATLVAYAAYTLLARQVRVPAAWQSWLAPLVGGATGLIAGATGVFVIPAVPYLQALGLEKDELVQALGLSFTVSTLALAASLGVHGAYGLDVALLSGLAVAPALAGMWAGQALRHKISPATFRRAFLIGLLLLGTQMLAGALLRP